MEIKKLIKKAINNTCIYFTVFTALYMLVLQIINIEDGAAAVEAPRVLLFFLASVLVAIANMLKSIKSIHSFARILLHYIICAFAFYACFMLPVKMTSSAVITGIIIFTVIYVLAAGVIAMFRSRLSKNREKNIAYSNQFKKSK